MADISAPEIKAWKLAPWLKSVNSARSSFYAWGEDMRPRTVLVGRNLLVTESAEAWLSRIAELQRGKAKKPRRQRRRMQAAVRAVGRGAGS